MNADGATSDDQSDELVEDVFDSAVYREGVQPNSATFDQLLADIVRVEVRLLGLPSVRTLATAHDEAPSPDRQLAVVGIKTSDGSQGWGECSALNAPTYTQEWAADSFDRLAVWADGGATPDAATHPMTFAAIEMALIDADLRSQGVSLAQSLGASATTVRAGATIGLHSVADSVATAKQLVEAGYRKLKVKIDPGQVDTVPHELTHVFEGRDDDPIEIHVDANGSLDEEHLMGLLGLTWHGVSVIEQPFAIDRPELAAELLLGSDVIVTGDEAVNNIADAQALLEAGALRGVAIKPPRVGGLAAAQELLSWCKANNVGASLGGMLECGLGRHALAAVGALDGFTITGDLSPASQWLSDDPWTDIEMIGPDIVVPTTPGVAPLPDQEKLGLFTLRSVETLNPKLQS